MVRALIAAALMMSSPHSRPVPILMYHVVSARGFAAKLKDLTASAY